MQRCKQLHIDGTLDINLFNLQGQKILLEGKPVDDGTWKTKRCMNEVLIRMEWQVNK